MDGSTVIFLHVLALRSWTYGHLAVHFDAVRYLGLYLLFYLHQRGESVSHLVLCLVWDLVWFNNTLQLSG